MPNTSWGNIWYFDTNGAINSSNNTHIQKIAIYAIDTTSQLVFAIGTGVPAVVLSFATSSPNVENRWREVSFNPPCYVKNASILSVTAGSGYVFIA